MTATLIALKAMTYGTRRLKAGDEFQATHSDCIVYPLIGLARAKPAEQSASPDEADEIHDALLHDLRAQYHELLNVPADRRWGVARLRKEIATAIDK